MSFCRKLSTNMVQVLSLGSGLELIIIITRPDTSVASRLQYLLLDNLSFTGFFSPR